MTKRSTYRLRKTSYHKEMEVFVAAAMIGVVVSAIGWTAAYLYMI